MLENTSAEQRIVEYYVDSERQYRSVWGLYDFPGIVLKTVQRLWDKSSEAKRKNVWSAWAQERARAKGLWAYHIVTARKPEAA